MIYTFYSFKGGVGRSMALASVAYLLATRGLRVLTIDFDLEAPGLERYFFESGRATSAKARPGLIDLLLAYKRALTNEEDFRKGEFRDWRNFVQPAAPSVAGGGCVDIMIAGQREPQERYGQYAAAVRGFDWMDFFHHWKGERFFDWLRSELVPDAQGQGGAYDAVLVDSRTGITEMGGVCAYQLADVAVMLCAANDQNLDGTLRVARDFRSDATLALRQGRPLELLVLPARLEASNERRQEFLAQFARTFDRAVYLPQELKVLGLDYEQLALPYDPAFAIIEQVVGESATRTGVATAAADTFERLADALTLLAWKPGRLQKEQEAARARLRGDGAPDGTWLPQFADATKPGADFDFFLDAPRDDHAPQNDAPPERPLADALRGAGLRVASLDETPSAALDLATAARSPLEASRALVVVLDRMPVSAWTSAVVDVARRLQRPILPFVVADSRGAPGWSALSSLSLGHLQAVQLDPAAPESWVWRIVRTWRDLQGRSEVAVAEATSGIDPYPGTRAFGEADKDFFFGRSAEVEALAKLVDSTELGMLVGPAGVGKTSLLLAGLLPALRQRTGEGPGRHYRVLYIDLATATDPLGLLTRWLDSPGPGPELVVLDSIDNCARSEGKLDPPGTETGGPPRGKPARAHNDIIGALLDLLAPRAHALLALRDSGDPAVELALSRWRLQRSEPGQEAPQPGRFELAPMGVEALTLAIERPAARLGHVVDPGVTGLLISQSGNGPGAVSELARALPVLWSGRRRGWLTLAPVDLAGNITGLFERAFAAFVTTLDAAEREAVQAMVRTLSRLDATMRWSAAPAEWDRLASMPALVRVDALGLRDRLAAAHFIDLWTTSQQSERAGAPSPHVALVHPSPGLYGPEHHTPFDPGFILWRQQFEAFVRSWTSASRASLALLSGQTLQEAELEAPKHPELLSEPERELIRRSRLRADAASLAKTRHQRLTYAGLVSLLLLAAVALFAIWRENGRATAAEAVARTAEDRARLAQGAAEAEARLSRDQVATLQRVVEKIGDPSLRRELLAEFSRPSTPELTSAQVRQLEQKISTATPSDPAGPRIDQPAGFKLWRNGSTLRLRFLDGTREQRAMALAAAKEWARHANVRFVEADDHDAEVRITFGLQGGSWALAGTDALGVPNGEPTMNLGIPEASSMRHEFGHVLGLIHEHQNPNAKLPWDRQAVYRDLSGPPNHWTRQMIDQQILVPEKITGYRAFDVDSIMMFAFAGTFFTDGYARGGKEELSASDKAFIAKLYPPTEEVLASGK